MDNLERLKMLLQFIVGCFPEGEQSALLDRFVFFMLPQLNNQRGIEGFFDMVAIIATAEDKADMERQVKDVLSTF